MLTYEGFGMTFHMWGVLLLIAGAMVAFASERIPMELTSIAALSMLLLFFYFFPLRDPAGQTLLDAPQLLLGFANPALIGVISLLILGQAIVQTGALNDVANVILHLGRNNALVSIGITLIIVATVSAFLNNTPVVVIFIPIMAALAKGLKMSVSKVMIPLSYASILGGMITLIGSSTNLLVSGVVEKMGYPPLGFFDFALPGLILAGVGLVYILIIAPRLLVDRASLVRSIAGEDDDRQFIAQVEVEFGSEFVGQKLVKGALPEFPEVAIKMIQRREHAFLPPFEEDITLKPMDIIIVAASKKDLTELFAKKPHMLSKDMGDITDQRDDEEGVQSDLNMAEVVVAPASRLVGRNLEQIGFYRQHNCVVLGIQRQTRIIRSRVTEINLAAGDVLLLMGKPDDILRLHENSDVLLLEWSTEEIHSGRKAGRTVVIFSTVVLLAAFDIVPIFISAFAGVAAVLIAGCINLRQMSRALDMKIVLIIGTSIAMGTALEATGAASYIAHVLIMIMHGASPLIIMSALFLLMAAVTSILSNNAAAVLFTPIAVNVAVQLGVDPTMFIFAVIFACNCSFATPIGYQTNLLVMGPGHHTFSDFMRSGIPLSLVIWATYTFFIAPWYFAL